MKKQTNTPNSLDRFVASIQDTQFCKPDGKPLDSWRLFIEPTLSAARSAARNAARIKAGSAEDGLFWDDVGEARDATEKTVRAACDAAGACDEHAAGPAARRYASAAAKRTGEDGKLVGLEVSRDAKLHACSLAVADRLPKDYVEHSGSRWEVWRKGYCLLCDMNGELFVYAVGTTHHTEC